MKVADYVMKFLQDKGVKHAFQVPGGGAMFLNDAVTKSSIEPVFCHHEQACAMAAVGYSKVENCLPLVVVTSGCGSTNAITGVLDAWQDSNPLFIISGQANKKDTTRLSKVPLRKLGVQEVDIIKIVSSITKYSTMIEDPNNIAYELEKAYHLSTTGRPGPVWIDIPLDVQSTNIDENTLLHWSKPKDKQSEIKENIFDMLDNSERPIIIAGNGIHLSGARDEFKRFVEKYNIPFAATFLATDILPVDHPLYVGRLGLKGTRAGNFAVANSDLVISIGSSLSIPVVGFNYKMFAREAKIVAVDIDPVEHKKDTIKVDNIIQSDAKKFLKENMLSNYKCSSDWSEKCKHWKNKWHPFDRNDINELNMYSFSKTISKLTKDRNSAIITDAGSAYYVLAQTVENNRLILPSAQGEMGFALPAAVGVYFADRSMDLLAVTGEGSLQFNLQEIQTMVQNNIPVKIFVLNNGGYFSIKNTQTKYFNKRYSGIDEKSGISFPECSKISNAYGIKYFKVDDSETCESVIKDVLEYDGCCICEVVCPPDEKIYPTSAAKQLPDGRMMSQPLENMAPFLPDEEFKEEMIISMEGLFEDEQ
tara:strand:+ start:7269 stop:9038 length:1770 start_codon:yes stop_codon:yes gene_type:complete